MNMIERPCKICGKSVLMSQDEFLLFGNALCGDDASPAVRRLRSLAVSGYYETDSIKSETVDNIIKKGILNAK